MIVQHLDYLSKKKIILASQSPRRAEILKLMGITEFTVQKSNFAEDLPKSSYPTPSSYAEATARQKALDVQRSLDKTNYDLIISSDTIVVHNDTILEKPASEGHAVEMLRQLSAQKHKVVTAVCLISCNGLEQVFSVETDVWFEEICDEDIMAYVKHGEPMDKAGAYGIQGIGASFVKRIDGCYFTVMGLPAHTLARYIRQLVDDGIL